MRDSRRVHLVQRAATASKLPDYEPRKPIDTSGFGPIMGMLPRWSPRASLEEIAQCWKEPGHQIIARLESQAGGSPDRGTEPALSRLLQLAALHASEGEAKRAYERLEEARALLARDEPLARRWLYSVIYFQGVVALRRGETENCVECRGESSCILPISEAAIHKIPAGSRLAIARFREYLERFPSDLGVKWLLNIAHMTLGEYPARVDPRFLLALDGYTKSEFDIGRFRDVGHLVGVNHFNQAGGAILDDFDNDGLLDLVISCFDPTEPMHYFHNKGDGLFEDRSATAGLAAQVGGGLYCVQTDYNNDGYLDVYVPRGAWLPVGVRPSLLRNNGDGTFTDVTGPAGLLDPVNSNSAAWADYDNDGWLDLFVCCERQPNRLYHNRRDGTFEEVAEKAKLTVPGMASQFCKGATWFDFDNDDYPDLFLNNYGGRPELYRNNHDGTFADVASIMGIDGPLHGFSCWAWDYDNDGWLDLFATCYDHSLSDMVCGIIGQPHVQESNRLFRNLQGKGFEDVTRAAGLDLVYASMGSNYADFDNDGFLDFYLGTGDPGIDFLSPNRMYKNVGGSRFAEITGSSRTGHLQKGHAVSCGDWDRDGDVDLFVETGGAINGDKYHNILFQNPGQGNHWLTLKLTGKKTNRAAIGARIKVVTATEPALVIERQVTSGSSFGANPLEQTIGLGKHDRIARLEIHWPASRTTQVFTGVRADQMFEVTEFEESLHPRVTKPLPQPK